MKYNSKSKQLAIPKFQICFLTIGAVLSGRRFQGSKDTDIRELGWENPEEESV